jgi:hypothetical protein
LPKGENITNGYVQFLPNGKIFQTAVNISHGHKLCQQLHSKALQNAPNWNFWYENVPHLATLLNWPLENRDPKGQRALKEALPALQSG